MGSDASLARRIELLRDSGQVDPDIAEFLPTAVAAVAEDIGVTVSDDSFGPALTHMALAFQRARRGDAIEAWSSDHGDELAAFPRIVARAELLASEAERRLGLTLPAKEREFIALHLAALTVRSAG
jgi:transcriptional regulatory protein LevR